VGDIPRGSFVASSYATFNVANRTFDLVNAGQPAPLLLRDGQVAMLEGPGSHLPLGVMATPIYETLCIAIEPGDLIVFYTDGVIEAHNRHHELFGFEGLEAVVGTCTDLDITPQQVVERVIAAVMDWIDDMPQHDDIALVVLQVTHSSPGTDGRRSGTPGIHADQR
jgi:serine phosphatase RsbU (regulator of sigma subunit)